MPAIQPTDNCKLADATETGLIINIKSTAALKAVGESYSLRKQSARMNRICMTQARVTDGVKPVTAANSIRIGIPISAVIGRFLPEITKITAKRMET